MKLRTLVASLAIAVGAIIFAPTPSHADMIWDFSYTGSGVSASGTLDTSSTLDAFNGYDILRITGQRNGDLITGIIPPAGTQNIIGNIVYDNILFPSAPRFDYDGLFYSTLTDGNFNLYYDSGQYYELTQAQAADGSLGIPVAITSMQVPEPPSILLFCAGLLAIGLMEWRRRRLGETEPSLPIAV